MTWLLWRQHRAQAATAAVAFAFFAVLLWVTGVVMANEYHRAIAACTDTGPCERPQLFNGDGAIIDLVTLSIAVPLLFGLFWGVTAIGRELDLGTHQLVWMQGVRRRVWLRDKIATVLILAALWGAAVSAIVTWWSGTLNALNGYRFDPGKFDIQGIVPVAYAVFGVALGLAAGAVLRRTLPALAATLGIFVVVRLLFISYVRPHLMAAKTLAHAGLADPPLPNGSWVLSRSLQLHGQPVSGRIDIPANCTAGSRQALDACLERLGYQTVAKYQPASRYWSFQLIEAGIFVALAALLVTVAVIAVRRRDA